MTQRPGRDVSSGDQQLRRETEGANGGEQRPTDVPRGHAERTARVAAHANWQD